jgi:hypothetical protein
VKRIKLAGVEERNFTFIGLPEVLALIQSVLRRRTNLAIGVFGVHPGYKGSTISDERQCET